MESILKETGSNAYANKPGNPQKGFTLLETMIALLVLAVGILGLAAMLGDSLAYMQGSQEDFIAQQKAEASCRSHFHRQIHQFDHVGAGFKFQRRQSGWVVPAGSPGAYGARS